MKIKNKYNSNNNIKRFKKSRGKYHLMIFVVVMLFVLSFTFSGCKKRSQRDVPQQNNTQNTPGVSAEVINYTFILPSNSSKRQIVINTVKGHVTDNNHFKLTGITAELRENGVDVATIIADNCEADLVDNIGIATITGNVRIRAKNEKNSIEIVTNEVKWRSDSNIITMEKFTIKLGDKGQIDAINGRVSTDLKTFDYEKPKMEMFK